MDTRANAKPLRPQQVQFVDAYLMLGSRCEPSGRFAFQHVRIRYEGELLDRHRAAFGHLGCT